VIDLQSVLARKQGRVFVPLVYRLAARLEQLEWDEFADDPPTAAFALRGAQRLFGLRALISHYRLGAEVEALGVDLVRDNTGEWAFHGAASSGLAVTPDAVRQQPLHGLIDLTRRLADELRNEAAVIAVLTGPRTLSALLGHSAGLAELYAALGRAYAEAGARALLVAEDSRLRDDAGQRANAAPNADAAILGPLLNVARYFRLPTVILAEHEPRLPTAWLQDRPQDHPLTDERGMYVTESEVPPDVPAERLRAWCDALR
jgi:hypothetical protein